MKKNLAKRIVLGLLTGAVLMSSSVAWADNSDEGYNIDLNQTYQTGDMPDDSLSIGGNITRKQGEALGSERSTAIGVGSQIGSVVNGVRNDCPDSVALGFYAGVAGTGGTAIGSKAKANEKNSVALGYGSIASEENVVSVGYGTTQNGVGVDYRRIVNVANGTAANDAVNVGQLQEVKDIVGTGIVSSKDSNDDYYVGSTKMNYFRFSNGDNLTEAVQSMASFLDPVVGKVYNDFYTKEDVYTKTEADARFVKIGENNVINNSITINENSSENPVTIGSEGITVGTNSTHMDSTGFYAGRIRTGQTDPHDYANAQAAITEDGKIKGAGGKFEVGTDGSVKAADDKFKVDKDGNVSAEKITAKEVTAENLYTKEQVNELIGGSNASVAGLNQRLEKTNAKINKVGAGAAALAALHPLDYDPDDKLTFSAGMGNYAGENAAALGAFYRPNEKFMLSLGGTMGNGENMVNLGLSIGLDKANGFAKMSKRELIQEVNAVKAENEAMKDQLANADERIAKLEALVAQLVAK